VTDDYGHRLLGLLGLALRAGRLAVGATAVERMVHEGRRPLLVIASDAGEGARGRLQRLTPVRTVLDGAVTRDELAEAFGRRELTVVAVSDPDFVKGIERLAGGPAAGGEPS
jgi:ribosomal protein L7Ae-like RNA K-turn-binding protein